MQGRIRAAGAGARRWGGLLKGGERERGEKGEEEEEEEKEREKERERELEGERGVEVSSIDVFVAPLSHF